LNILNNLRLNRSTVVLRQTAIFFDRWHWVLLALTAPFLLFPSPSRSLALFVVPGLWIVAWMAGREPLPHTPLNAALLLMFFMVLVSLRIQPGLTGWWQVMGRHGTTFEQRLRLDE